MSQQEQPHYRSYLLRCWVELSAYETGMLWRFSLEDTQSGQRQGFARLSDLSTALELMLAQALTRGKDTAQEALPERVELTAS